MKAVGRIAELPQPSELRKAKAHSFEVFCAPNGVSMEHHGLERGEHDASVSAEAPNSAHSSAVLQQYTLLPLLLALWAFRHANLTRNFALTNGCCYHSRENGARRRRSCQNLMKFPDEPPPALPRPVLCLG